MGFKRLYGKLMLALALFFCGQSATAGLIITGVIDGPLSGGVPKAVELYVTADNTDLSRYRLENYNNGSSSNTSSLDLSGTADQGDYIYIASETEGFTSFFGFAPDFTGNVTNVNGDDAFRLFEDGAVIDSFGVVGVDGTGEPWEYRDGWAYRNSNTTPDGSAFNVNNWSFSGTDTLDGFATNDEAGTNKFPIGTYGGNSSTEPPEPSLELGVCGDTENVATLISAIQGSGLTSPEVGNEAVIEGIVTATFPELDGYFVQEEAGDNDGNAETSEGIFIYLGEDSTIAVGTGDQVRLLGTVSEQFSQTQLADITANDLCSENNTIEAVNFSLPIPAAVDGVDYRERFEGMLVQFADENGNPISLTVSDHFNHGRFGELTLSNGRLYNPTHLTTPGTAANEQAAANALNQILLDDGRSGSNNEPILNPTDQDNDGEFDAFDSADKSIRNGSLLGGGTAILSFGFSEYRLQPVTPFTISNNERPESPELPGTGDLTVAAYNVLNYFTTLDGNGAICGPDNNQNCRGADSAKEFERQKAKIAAAIAEMDADIVGLMEIENNALASLSDLVAAVNSVAGAGTYAYLDTGMIGTDSIKVGFIYKPATVIPVGGYAILDSSIDANFIDDKNRPSLIQTFAQLSNGEKLTLSVNHFKSKGSNCNDLGDPDAGDGQGNCNLTRNKAAQALVDYLKTDPTNSGDPDFMIIGDINAYAMEDPIQTFKAGGYTNLIEDFLGAAAYSFTFFGEAGYLDHALANSTLAGQVTGVTEWHINADEPRIIDYNTEFKSDTQDVNLYAADPFRSSDHDPVIVELKLGSQSVVRKCFGRTATIYVNNQSNRIVGGPQNGQEYQPGMQLMGTPDRDIIVGGPLADKIYGLGGNDLICGSKGDDEIFGGEGDDRLHGNRGKDRIYGEAGKDELRGGRGNDWLDGGPDKDRIYGGLGNDRIFVGNGQDKIDGGRGIDKRIDVEK